MMKNQIWDAVANPESCLLHHPQLLQREGLVFRGVVVALQAAGFAAAEGGYEIALYPEDGPNEVALVLDVDFCELDRALPSMYATTCSIANVGGTRKIR